VPIIDQATHPCGAHSTIDTWCFTRWSTSEDQITQVTPPCGHPTTFSETTRHLATGEMEMLCTFDVAEQRTIQPPCGHSRTYSRCTYESDGLVQYVCDYPVTDEPIMSIRSCRICEDTITDTADVCAACARDEMRRFDQAQIDAERRAERGPVEIDLDPERPINAVRPDNLYAEGPSPRLDFID